jgi:mono/diheme cytochrome c family protein
VEAPPAPEPAVEVSPEPAKPEAVVDEEFTNHMHAHAEQLDELMFALADGDLDGAMTPAYWLGRHKTVRGIPDEWQHFVSGVREAALAVESANDIETARAAAEEISNQCQGCHTVAGVVANK